MKKFIAAAVVLAGIGSLSACGSGTSPQVQALNCQTAIVQVTDLSLDMSAFGEQVQMAQFAGGWAAVVVDAHALAAKLAADAAPLSGTPQGDAVVAAVKVFGSSDLSTQASLTAALAGLKTPVADLAAVCKA